MSPTDRNTLDYSGLAECMGLGRTGSNRTGAHSRGIEMHSTLAINAQGVPLGIVDVRCRTPDPEAEPSTPQTPLEQKKSFDWVLGLGSCMELAEQLPETRITCVMDCEADFFELFDRHRQNPSVDLLIRAQYNRQTSTQLKLFDRLRQSPVRGTAQLHLKRQSARPKRAKQKSRPGRAARLATLELHYEKIEFAAPAHLKGKAPLCLWAVLAREKNPPPDGERLEWCLLTSRALTEPADTERCLSDYALRWRIEIDQPCCLLKCISAFGAPSNNFLRPDSRRMV